MPEQEKEPLLKFALPQATDEGRIQALSIYMKTRVSQITSFQISNLS